MIFKASMDKSAIRFNKLPDLRHVPWPSTSSILPTHLSPSAHFILPLQRSPSRATFSIQN